MPVIDPTTAPGPLTRRRRPAATLMLAVLCACAALGAQPPTDTSEQARRAAKRLRALNAEADALAAEGRSLLVELRRREVARQLRGEELRKLAAETAVLEEEITDAGRQIELLLRTRDDRAPVWRARMAGLYKLGRGGYARMLLGLDDVRQVGRAYRMVSVLADRDRELARAHQSTRASLEEARAALVERHRQVAALREQAVAARAAADRAVREQAALVAAVDERRDLNAQLAGELRAARDRLQATVTGLDSGVEALPLRPFRGALEWPAGGRVLTPFASSSSGGRTGPSGIEIAATPGAPVAAVHDGVVAYAAPFTGFGNLVIVDHGAGSHTLYGYLERLDVERGATVSRGTRLGTVGAAPAGWSALYFELRIDGRAVDPLQWLKRQP